MVSVLRFFCVFLSFSVLALSHASPTRAETICRCQCFPVPGGRVCRRYCYETGPFDYEAPERDWQQEDYDAAPQPEAQQEETQPDYGYATYDDHSNDDAEVQQTPLEDDYAVEDRTADLAANTPDEPANDQSATDGFDRDVADESDSTKSGRSLDPETRALIREVIIGGVSMVVGAGALRLLSRLSVIARTRREIAVIGRRARSAQQVDKKLRHAAREADILIERYRRQFYRQGYDQ